LRADSERFFVVFEVTGDYALISTATFGRWKKQNARSFDTCGARMPWYRSKKLPRTIA
jgi:hypothetical protein